MSLLDDYVGNGHSNNAIEAQVSGETSSGLAQFKIDQVTLPGSLDIVCAAVKNNILVIAIVNNKLLKIDLSNPAEIQDLEIPRAKNNDGATIYKIHLDDTGSHLLVTTTKGDNWYLHTKLSRPVKLKARGIVESIAWNGNGTVYATKEILFGMTSGAILETWLEPIEGFNKTVERYLKQVHTLPSGTSVTGLKTYPGLTLKDVNVLVSSQAKVEHFKGSVGGGSGDAPVMHSVFAGPSASQEFAEGYQFSQLAMFKDDEAKTGRHFAWLSSSGVLHGSAPVAGPGDSSFEDTKLIGPELYDRENIQTPVMMELSTFHILMSRDNSFYAFNHFDGRKIHQERMTTLDPIKGMMADPVQQTYWVYSRTELFEIVITDESQHMWEIFLKRKDYGSATRYASNPAQNNAIHAAQAQSLMEKHDYDGAAELFARTSIPIETVALDFLDLGERDALLTYLLHKLESLKKSAEMQRTMLSTWILELFMNKFSALDDLRNNLRESADHTSEREKVAKQYSTFINKHKLDLDKEAAYALINSHGHQDELMIFANAIEDHEYIVDYYIQRDQFSEALSLLTKHPNYDLTYSTSTILLPEIPQETVEMWMRLSALDPTRLLPAILTYNARRSIPIAENQAVRYLQFTIKHQGNTDSAIHNALIGIYARDCGGDEDALLAFLESQDKDPHYDLDFGLRQCKQHDRLMSCVHIYSSMGLHDQAVQWALQHDNVQLAGIVADRVQDNQSLRKKLWLMIAKKTITKEGGMKEAIEMSKKNDILRIEDLVPHFDEFTIIDDFKDEICTALEGYSANIENLREEMDESSRTADTICQNIEDLKRRFALIQVGEECYSCHRPLMEKQFYVFPCQHTFHNDCLVRSALKASAPHQRRRIAQLQSQISRLNTINARAPTQEAANEIKSNHNGALAINAGSDGPQKQVQACIDELDDIVAAECLLCGSGMISSIDEGFLAMDDKLEAASWRL